MKIKTRFAPSPTGYLHIGSARTALYSWLFAHHHEGNFLLRIEDTDLKRSESKAVDAIIESMKWLNLSWDEGPYFQTERFDRYNAVIDDMLKIGKAYKCYCTKTRLEILREEQLSRGEKPHYDRCCRYKNRSSSNEEPCVVRFANPQEGLVIFKDQIHGLIKFNNQELDDLIIRRSDGFPTYNFCVVIDDWDMGITHVIRGEDHINNTPRQINILKALNASIPIYAHVSMINGEDGRKLSKRHGAISVMQYRDDGYLPEALLNYLVRLGWSNNNQEIFSRQEMIKFFSITKVSKSPSTFNIDKLLWLNHYYINSLPTEYVATHLKWQIQKINIDTRNGPQLSEIIKLLGKRYKTLKEIAEKCRYFYEEFEEFNKIAAQEYLCQEAYLPLEVIRDKLATIREWTIEKVDHAIQVTSDELKIKIKRIWMPLRVAVTGSKESPEINSTVHAIGKIRSISRINKALNFIKNREFYR